MLSKMLWQQANEADKYFFHTLWHVVLGSGSVQSLCRAEEGGRYCFSRSLQVGTCKMINDCDSIL